jgi:hypothetical protein
MRIWRLYGTHFMVLSVWDALAYARQFWGEGPKFWQMVWWALWDGFLP